MMGKPAALLRTAPRRATSQSRRRCRKTVGDWGNFTSIAHAAEHAAHGPCRVGHGVVDAPGKAPEGGPHDRQVAHGGPEVRGASGWRCRPGSTPLMCSRVADVCPMGPRVSCLRLRARLATCAPPQSSSSSPNPLSDGGRLGTAYGFVTLFGLYGLPYCPYGLLMLSGLYGLP